jgi:hypothetical protein
MTTRKEYSLTLAVLFQGFSIIRRGQENEFTQVSMVDAVCPDVVHFGCGAGA